jgi:hypothetical protein
MSPLSARLELLAALHNRSPLDIVEWHAERSAILQYDANLTRAEADRAALVEIERELEGRDV